MAALVAKLKWKLIALLQRCGVARKDFVLCSDCFQDQGLKLDAQKFGIDDSTPCVNCHLTTGRKLTKQAILHLSHRFFVWGTLLRCEYGAAPRVQFNDKHGTIEDGLVSVRCINRLVISRVDYEFHFGPVATGLE